MKKEIEICLEIIWETDKAFQVTDDGKNIVWIPKSQAEPDQNYDIGDAVTFIMPEWLAIEKGFV